MQQRHLDRLAYFNELANTAREFYLDYIKAFHEITPQCQILEIGCGEGGNLLPFAEIGCKVTGIDRSSTRIDQAKEFFSKAGYKGKFIAIDFIKFISTTQEKFDIVLIHDVIEHVEEKETFVRHIKNFVNDNSIIFWGFPAWQMPFGGHQQICHSKICSHVPFTHLLPTSLYRLFLKMCGESDGCINELIEIKRCKMTIEAFEELMRREHFECIDRLLWLINPHYKQKFHLKPRELNRIFSQIKYFRGFFSTSCFYQTKYKTS